MTGPDGQDPLIRVERIALRGPGVLILTGAWGCGQGAWMDALCELLSIDPRRRLSARSILRATALRAKGDPIFAKQLETRAALSRRSSIFDCLDTREELVSEVRRRLPDLERCLGRAPSRFISEEVSGVPVVSQLDWLEYCGVRGLPVPERWSRDLVAAELEARIEEVGAPSEAPFVLEGHPSTPASARHLLGVLARLGLPVRKLLHLSVDEAAARARARQRTSADGPDATPAAARPEGGAAERRLYDFLAGELGVQRVSWIEGDPFACIETSATVRPGPWVANDFVLAEALAALGVPRVVVRDLLEVTGFEREGGG